MGGPDSPPPKMGGNVAITSLSNQSFCLLCAFVHLIIVREYVFYVFQNPKMRLFAFLTASACNSDRNVSVCLSVTRRYCVKTKKVSGMISSPSVSPKTLVFRHKFHHQILRGSPRTGASNKSRSEKFSDFLPLSVNISKTVADMAKVTISH